MRLIKNIPLNTNIIAELISDPNDLYLVWPAAYYPFSHKQWYDVLNPETGVIPFLAYEGNQLIGHAAIRKTEYEDTYSLNMLYIIPDLRSKGLGEEMIHHLEQYARDNLHPKKLSLVVRTYNPRAQKCYIKCGFIEYSRNKTLMSMVKVL